MIIALRILRVLFAAVGLWQIIGIVPVVTWASNPRAVTLGMAATIVFKVVVAAICAGAFYWLGKLKRKRSTTKERISDVAIAGTSLVVMAAIVLVVALVLPSGRGGQEAASSPAQPTSLAKEQDKPPCPAGQTRIAGQSTCIPWSSFTPISPPDTATAANGWTQESTNSKEVGPWLSYDPPGTRYCRYSDGTIQRLYPPGVRPNAPAANPFCLPGRTVSQLQ